MNALQSVWDPTYALWTSIHIEIRVILLSLAAIIIWTLIKHRLTRKIFRIVIWTIAVRAILLWATILIFALSLIITATAIGVLLVPLFIYWKLLGWCMTLAGLGDWWNSLSTSSQSKKSEEEEEEPPSDIAGGT